MVVAVGETEVLPLVVLLPLHPPDAVHEVAFVLDQVRIEDWPDVIVVGLAEIVTVGGVEPGVPGARSHPLMGQAFAPPKGPT